MIGVVSNKNQDIPLDFVGDCNEVLYVVCMDGSYIPLRNRLKAACQESFVKFHIIFIIPFVADITEEFLRGCGSLYGQEVCAMGCSSPLH